MSTETAEPVGVEENAVEGNGTREFVRNVLNAPLPTIIVGPCGEINVLVPRLPRRIDERYYGTGDGTGKHGR